MKHGLGFFFGRDGCEETNKGEIRNLGVSLIGKNHGEITRTTCLSFPGKCY